MKNYTTLPVNRNTYDIMNAIRNSASPSFREQIETIDKGDFKAYIKVGDKIANNPGLANEFISTLMNKVAITIIRNSIFSNPYAPLKKGMIGYGELIEELFIEASVARDFSKAKADKREYQRTLPKVRSAFHVLNYAAQYAVTIDQEQLKRAFTTEEGLNKLIDNVTNSLTEGANMDEFLLFKYLLIKNIAKGGLKEVGVPDPNNIKEFAVKTRALSNQLTFPSNKFNQGNVTTHTPKGSQIVFLDANYAAKYDVELLASSFNMDRATFEQSAFLIDDWASFDNERLKLLRETTEQLEEVTKEELNVMKGVLGVVVDREFFQFYDNQTTMTSNYSAAGLYTNFFLTIEKTISTSPFSNAVVLMDSSAINSAPASVKVRITGKKNTKFTESVKLEVEGLKGPRFSAVSFVETEDAITKEHAVLPDGVIFATKLQPINLEIVSGNEVYELKAADITQALDSVLTLTKKK